MHIYFLKVFLTKSTIKYKSDLIKIARIVKYIIKPKNILIIKNIRGIGSKYRKIIISQHHIIPTIIKYNKMYLKTIKYILEQDKSSILQAK